MPCLLMGAGVINYTEEQIKYLQRIENRVFRQLLGGLGDTPIAILRGEVGASMVRTRIIQARLMLTKSIIDGDNLLLKTILTNIRRLGGGRWYGLLSRYLQDVGLTFDELETMGKSDVWKRIRDYDDKEWAKDMDKLTDRAIYKTYKKGVGGSWGYDNSVESDLLFQVRSNSLRVNAWYRHVGDEVGCKLCGAALENLEHFILYCPSLNTARDDRLIMEVGGVGTDQEKVGRLVYDRGRIGEVKKMLGKLWRERLYRLGKARATAATRVNHKKLGKGRGGNANSNPVDTASVGTAVTTSVRPRRRGTCYALGRWG